MIRRASLLLVFLILASGCGRGSKEPTLVVTLVVDGLSTDQLSRHRDCLGEAGFARLMNEGSWMREARLTHASTFTAPAHATIASGTSPRTHGVVGNSWFDRERGRNVYCVEDEQHERIGESGSKARGVSPAYLLVPTMGDLLDDATGGESKTVSVSIKDRSAVLGAGRTGVAYFFSRRSGRFVSSTFYLREMPQWWDAYYEDSPQDRWFGDDLDQLPCPDRPWYAAHEASLEYVADEDLRLRPPAQLRGQSDRPDRAYYSAMRETPRGDEAVLEFAQQAIAGEELGQRGVVDHLFLSLSSLDYLQHAYGPDSPRATALLVGLDHQLAKFFDALDASVGKDRWIVALTSDHGYPSSPEVARVQGRESGRIDPASLKQVADEAIAHRFGGKDWISSWAVPSLYFDHAQMEDRGLDPEQVERVAAQALSIQPGVQAVATRTAVMQASFEGPYAASVQAAFHVERCGDLFVIQKPDWYLMNDPNEDAATHGSPHDYDRRVPVILYGSGFVHNESDAPAAPRDIVPTFLDLLGIEIPGHIEGRVLEGALSR